MARCQLVRSVLIHGLEWPRSISPLQVEMKFIQSGGFITIDGKKYGNGLFEHYKAMEALIWPDDYQNRWTDWMLKTLLEERISVFGGSKDCVAAHTRIPNPITGERPTIKELMDSGTEPMVMTLEGLAKASIPFLHGEGKLYEVTCENGSQFTGSLKHFVLSSHGFVPLESLVPGQAIYSVEPEFPGSNSEPCPSIRASDDQRWFGKVQGSQAGYHRVCDSCGVPLPAASRTCREPFPSQGDAPIDNRDNYKTGVMGNGSKHSPACPAFSRPSNGDCERLESFLGMGGPSLPSLGIDELGFDSFQQASRFLKSSRFCREEIGSIRDFVGKQLGQYVDSCSNHKGVLTVVQSIKPAGTGKFYDLTVPGIGHYFSEGAIHHNSGKTRRVSKWALMDYWCFPDTTLILMTSTTTRGLELRVYGDIKSLWERGTTRFPFLAGNPLDSKHGIFTDLLDDSTKVRDMRKGIIGIPTMTTEGAYDGSALVEFAGIKQVRRRLIGDEMQHIACFPAGTIIDTASGPARIETVRLGDRVISASGFNLVIGITERLCSALTRITTKDGRQLCCTPNHPILTNKGWKRACDINQYSYIVSAYEAMSILWEDVQQIGKGESLRGMRQQGSPMRILRDSARKHFSEHEKSFLRFELLREMEAATTRDPKEDVHYGASRENQPVQNTLAPGQSRIVETSCAFNEELDAGTGMQASSVAERVPEGFGTQTEDTGREWDRTHQSRMATNAHVSRGTMELWNQYRKMERERISSGLQSGPCIPINKTGHRGRWTITRCEEGSRYEEGHLSEGSWVDRIEVLKPGNTGFPNSDSNSARCRVYNLQVEGHPSYSVNGLMVHNCDYLKVLFAMDDGEFKGAFLGNMIADNGRALDKVAEPENGWGSEGEIKKTTAWRNKFNGVTLNLVGIDSPNLDPETKNKFPGMITQDSIDRAAKLPGAKDSLEWWSVIMGVRKAGAVSNRVLTVAEIERYGGFKECIWEGSPRTKVYSIDAGFGGDPCVRTWLEFGAEVNGQQIIQFGDQKVIPILLSSGISAEKQIARFAKIECDTLGIPYSNIFFDAGMYATLAVEMAREMSPAVNAVNFGGTATERPVGNDMMVFDHKTQTRRSKTWYEHVSKFVTELHFVVRLLAQCRQLRKFPRAAAEEFGRREWQYVYGDRYELENKDKYKLRNGGESPNYADSLVIGVEGARRLGFAIENMPDPNAPPKVGDDYIERELAKYQKERKKRQLSYT